MRSLPSVLLVTLFLLSGCAVNPVTGDRQFTLMSGQQEVSIGEQNYSPMQQQQGGPYTLDPGVNQYVQKIGQSLARVSDRPDLPYEFVVINNGVPNAWALPGGKIAINRGLLQILENEAQLAAVLGHEIVHAAARHSAQQMTRAALLGLGAQAAGSVAGDSEYGQLIGVGAAVGAKAWQASYSRDHEFEADRYGIEYMAEVGYDPQGAVQLQQKFVELSEGKESGGLGALFASHPPSQDRVERNRELAKEYSGSRLGREEYLQATAQLRQDQDAYDAHLQALEALQQQDFDQALNLLDQAIERQPAEGLFYATRGQVLLARDKKDEALQAFQQAKQKNPNYFVGHLGSGLLQKDNGQYDNARQNLEQSVEMLPTQIAVYHLGELAQRAGNRDQAIQYYQQAAQGGGELGERAQQRLVELQANTQ